MLRTHGADFLVRRQLTAPDLVLSLGEVCFFLGRQLDRRLFDARELQHYAGKLVLPRVGQGRNRTKSFFEKARHPQPYHNEKAPAKPGLSTQRE
jgi:hypothetical protein